MQRYAGYASQITPARWKLPDSKLVEIDAALSYITSWNKIDVATLRSIVGVLKWCFLFRRCLFSILHAVYDVLERYADGDIIPISRAVREELIVSRRLLPLSYGDTFRRVLPVVGAQDAEGESKGGLGGWGLGFAIPNAAEVVDLALTSMAQGVPKDAALESSRRGIEVRSKPLSDLAVPEPWTDGSTRWYDVLARAHSYPEHTNLYEVRVLGRSFERICKLGRFRRSRYVALEDNQVVCGFF